MENNWSFKYELLGLVGYLRKNLTLFLPLRIAEEFLTFYTYLSCPSQNLFGRIELCFYLSSIEKLWTFLL